MRQKSGYMSCVHIRLGVSCTLHQRGDLLGRRIPKRGCFLAQCATLAIGSQLGWPPPPEPDPTLMEQQTCSSRAPCALLRAPSAAEQPAGMTGMLAPSHAGRPSLTRPSKQLLPLMVSALLSCPAQLPLSSGLGGATRNRSPCSGSITYHNLRAQPQNQLRCQQHQI